MDKLMKSDIKTYLLLHILLVIFSFSSVCSKLAAGEEFMSFRFIALYGLVILLLGIYAIFWQQVIKNMPLTAAYANRAVTVFWGMVWGLIIFKEKITLGKAVGAVIVIAGIILFALSDREEAA
ncbi:MAG: transporter [Lachnospiraceae bacterium]|nr:transporter [Lachnospiraceae bacterium]